jgi:RNA polymerase sigma factor (sigma-70 family)
VAEERTGSSFYQKLAAYPLMSPERRQQLLSDFYDTQLKIIDLLSGYMVPLYRYFAQELEQRNTEMEADDSSEGAGDTRLSRLRGGQLKLIAKLLMELREAKEKEDAASIALCCQQFKELMLGFDYALLSTIASSRFLLPAQEFILTAPQAEDSIRQLKGLLTQADADRDELFTGNWRLVMEIARRFQAFGSKLDLDELIQEGNTGLLAAIDKFNPRLNNQLSTLAANWIQAKIRRALDNKSETIRTPVYKRQRKKIVQRAEMELLIEARQAQQQGKSTGPSTLQTGTERLFGRSIEDKAIAERTGLPVEEVQELRRLYPETVSIHATVDGSDDSDAQERGDLIADKAHEEASVHDQADKQLFFKVIGELVADLSLEHQIVLSGLHGLPMRKVLLKRLVEERLDILVRRGRALEGGNIPCIPAQIQIFR